MSEYLGCAHCPFVVEVSEEDPDATLSDAVKTTPRTVEDAARAWADERWPMEDDTHAAVARHAAVEGALWQAARMPSVDEVEGVLREHWPWRSASGLACDGTECDGWGASYVEFAQHQAEQVVALWGGGERG